MRLAVVGGATYLERPDSRYLAFVGLWPSCCNRGRWLHRRGFFKMTMLKKVSVCGATEGLSLRLPSQAVDSVYRTLATCGPHVAAALTRLLRDGHSLTTFRAGGLAQSAP